MSVIKAGLPLRLPLHVAVPSCLVPLLSAHRMQSDTVGQHHLTLFSSLSGVSVLPTYLLSIGDATAMGNQALMGNHAYWEIASDGALPIPAVLDDHFIWSEFYPMGRRKLATVIFSFVGPLLRTSFGPTGDRSALIAFLSIESFVLLPQTVIVVFSVSVPVMLVPMSRWLYPHTLREQLGGGIRSWFLTAQILTVTYKMIGAFLEIASTSAIVSLIGTIIWLGIIRRQISVNWLELPVWLLFELSIGVISPTFTLQIVVFFSFHVLLIVGLWTKRE